MDRPECECAVTAIRRRTQSNGVEIYAVQCLNCGRMLRAVSKKDHEATGDFDEELREQWDARLQDYWRNSRATHERVATDEQREWWTRYNNYLSSPEWKARRIKVFKRANYTCEGCGDRPATQVHHMTYDHVGNEFLWELRAVCDECHKRIHEPKRVAI